MHRDVSSRPAGHLTPVSLPPLPARGPGAAHRQLSAVSRPPTPPPRPESSLVAPPPPPSSGPAQPSPGAGRVPPSTSDIALQLPAALSSLEPAPAPITLTSPRSHGARTQNLYVDMPFKENNKKSTRVIPQRNLDEDLQRLEINNKENVGGAGTETLEELRKINKTLGTLTNTVLLMEKRLSLVEEQIKLTKQSK